MTNKQTCQANGAPSSWIGRLSETVPEPEQVCTLHTLRERAIGL